MQPIILLTPPPQLYKDIYEKRQKIYTGVIFLATIRYGHLFILIGSKQERWKTLKIKKHPHITHIKKIVKVKTQQLNF